MCVLSSHTCGACLAKWNGQLWKETYEGVLPLKGWTLVLNKSFQLCIEGHYDDYGLDLNICIPVKKRVNSRWVANERTLIKLHGPLYSKDLPDFVVARFADGIPENWKFVAQKWIDYINHGDNSFVSLNETFTSDSSRGSRNRRNLGIVNKGGRGGLQRRPPAAIAAASTKHQSSDSAFQSLQSSSAVATNRGTSRGSNWISPSPWLPPHKVKEITQWMNRSPVTPHIPTDPLTGLESEPGDGGSIMDLQLGGLPSGGACTTVSSSSNRLSASSRLRQLSGTLSVESNNQRNNVLTQSTPLSGTQDIRPSANPLNISMTMSSISHMDLSSGMTSFESIVPQDDLFRKPMLDAHGKETPANSTRLPSKPTLSSTPSPNQRGNLETSEAEVGGIENRPRGRLTRKHTPQKIERWRPILGVDGNIKLQGYLVLRGDMTAGQILTTNTVVVWLGTKVTTCDEREYELIGDIYDPSGKISESLKKKMKKPMNCSDIQEALQETQALRDRSDWGAEYDIFYDDSANPEISSSSVKTPRSSSRRSNSSSNNNKKKNQSSATPSLSASTARRLSNSPHTTPRGSVRRTDGDEDFSDVSLSPSPARKSLRLTNNSKAESGDKRRFPRSKSNNKTSSILRSELPRAMSKTDYVMHVSPSRIKVSYPSKTPPTLVSSSSSSKDTSVRCRPQSVSSNTTPSRSRTSRCPAKLSCDTCCGSPTTNSSHTTPPPRPNRREESQDEDENDNENHQHLHQATMKKKKTAITLTTSSPTNTSAREAARTRTKTKMENQKQENTSGRLSSSITTTSTTSTTSSSPKKKSRHATKASAVPPPVDRNLRGSLGKTRMQTLSKSPQVLLTPLDRRMYSPNQKRKPRAGKSLSVTALRQQQRQNLSLSPKKLFPPSPSVLKSTNTDKIKTNRKAGTGENCTSGTSTAVANENEKTTRVLRRKIEKVSYKEGTEDENEEKEEVIPTQKTARSNSKKKSNSSNNKSQLTSSKNMNSRQKQNRKKTDEEGEKEEGEQQKENVKTTKQTAMRRQKENQKTTHQKARSATLLSPEVEDVSQECEDKEDNASVCSDTSDISIGPSASVIFALNAAAAEAAGFEKGEEGDGRQRAPRTLRERRARDAALQRMATLVEKMAEAKATAVAEKGGTGGDDDPVAQLINSHPFQPLPQEWCDHRSWMRGQGGRKRRRPSSSDGTASPSRCSALSYGGYEDATSSVATPQLLMRRPDPKQVQSYLQRLRALKSKPHRPTRKVRADRQLTLPDIDYSQAFHDESSSESSGSESLLDSDWEG